MHIYLLNSHVRIFHFLFVCEGLNNVGLNDSINCVIQALAHVSPFRDFFLSESNYRLEAHKPAHPLGKKVNYLLVVKNHRKKKKSTKDVKVSACVHMCVHASVPASGRAYCVILGVLMCFVQI